MMTDDANPGQVESIGWEKRLKFPRLVRRQGVHAKGQGQNSERNQHHQLQHHILLILPVLRFLHPHQNGSLQSQRDRIQLDAL